MVFQLSLEVYRIGCKAEIAGTIFYSPHGVPWFRRDSSMGGFSWRWFILCLEDAFVFNSTCNLPGGSFLFSVTAVRRSFRQRVRLKVLVDKSLQKNFWSAGILPAL
ncbi:MAG: hypothetical protein Q7J38_08375 [Gallionella sp.]|nr:hypothetical protein [Gallionella sp.]